MLGIMWGIKMINRARRTNYIFAVVFVILLVFIIATLFGQNLDKLSTWMSNIGIGVTILFTFYNLFDRYIWKLAFINVFVGVPNLNGTWKGTLISDFDGEGKGKEAAKHHCMLVINQTYSKVKVRFFTNESRSYSFSEEINLNNEAQTKRLSYSYTNEASTLLRYKSPNHRGTVVLDLINDNKLSGYYYTDRNTKGELIFEFYNKKLLDEVPSNIK